MTMTLNLHQFDRIMVNSSGGKDSQTVLREVMRLVDLAGYPRENIVVFHADLGRVEWPGVKELTQEQAEHYGLRFVTGKYRNKDGENPTLLDYVRKRGKWPDNKNRFCTSDFKRGPGGRVLTQLSRDVGKDCRILNVFGFRAEESPARAKKQRLAFNEKASTKARKDGTRMRAVWDWCPILDWKEDQVWQSIRDSGVRHHRAYDLGMPRLSCAFCIFAPKTALMIAGSFNPELLDEYVAVEQEIGHTFTHKLPIADVKKALETGEQPDTEDLHGCWNM